MRKFFLAVLATLLVIGSLPAPASALSPIESKLVGKTCRMGFNAGSNRPLSKGAVQIRFYQKGNVLAGALGFRFGDEAYKNALVTSIPDSEERDVKNLEVGGNDVTVAITFMSSNEALWTVVFRPADNKVVGKFDPTYHPERRNWVVMPVDMPCSEVAPSVSSR